MKATLILAVCLILTGPIRAQTPTTDIQAFAWMSGCWVATDLDGRIVTEQWMKPLGPLMMGMSRTVKDDRVLAYEFIRLEQGDDGYIRYIATPSGQRTASFALKELSGSTAVFENPGNDFPQRIVYELTSKDSLVARIEGTSGAQRRTSTFRYRRENCQ